ncbi:hypothetical protein GDO81_018358 [Engystomops pustulosus]|uniref:Uncharacterized protein n=1 Tax=Engystomops pustulosus TaxID=76066 RepID=A0AAV7A6E8_ENGPU|nr:hypothetical protein GDO81_018358 [Engystomops pustulosus]
MQRSSRPVSSGAAHRAAMMHPHGKSKLSSWYVHAHSTSEVMPNLSTRGHCLHLGDSELLEPLTSFLVITIDVAGEESDTI